MSSAFDVTPDLMLSDELRPRELIETAVLAEHLGYRTLWYTDQRFWRDCYSGLTLISQHTNRLHLGPGVNDPYTRHPATIAMAIATLDELTEGRARLGIGIGGSGIAQMRLPKERPVRALQEAIEMIKLMLSEPDVHYDGELYKLIDGGLGFTPYRSEIPTYVATHSPQTLRLSGRLAEGVLLGNIARGDAVNDAVAHVRNGEQAAGREPGSTIINLRLEALVSDNPEPALQEMKRRFAYRMMASYPHWDYLARLHVTPSEEMRDAAEARDLDQIISLLSNDDVRSTTLVGTKDEVVEQLGDLMVSGTYEVTIRPYSVSGSSIRETIVSFAQDVWPRVAERLRNEDHS
jgi:5,10-methylenetetrahydromethanopterin reductase